MDFYQWILNAIKFDGLKTVVATSAGLGLKSARNSPSPIVRRVAPRLNFIKLVKWVGGFVILIVAGMAYFLT